MSGQTSPPGKTFKERWPDDVATADYLAGPLVPTALGGLAGLIGAPAFLAALVFSSWVSIIAYVATLALLTGVLWPSRGAIQRWAGRLWRFVAWVGLAALAGLVMGIFATILCEGSSCFAQDRNVASRVVPVIVVFATSVAGSTLAAVAADRAARRLTVR
jgi:hypothetical protein